MKIGVVIVTYNRLEKLKETLKQFSCQTRKPEYILIIDNASTDQTSKYLENWKEIKEEYKKIVITMDKNIGGSGGFYTGLQKSLEMEADWIWVSDDDAVPEINAIDEAYHYLNKNLEREDQISAICGQVINNGQIDIDHRKKYISKGIHILEVVVPAEEYEKEEFELNAFSYVGTIINREKMRQVGITKKEYFIWWDDIEHSLRLSKVGKIICVPRIRIHHDVGADRCCLSWKSYYGFRNMTDVYSRYMPKPCFLYFCLKIRIKLILYSIINRDSMEIKLLKEGYTDARKGRFGIHPIYQPGWGSGKELSLYSSYK